MEKKHFEEFIDLFGALTDAGIIISGKYKKELEDFLLSAIERRLIQLENLDLCLPEGLMEEIEKNFYDHKDDRETYLIRIIRYFKDISPFLCIEFHKEYVAASIGRNGLKIGNRVYLENHVSTHKTVEKYCHWITPHLEIDTATNTEKYVILCYEAYQSFFKLLDPLCIDFGLDLPEIQNRINIQVWKRNEIMLRCMDYYLTPKQQEKTQLETKPTFEPKIEVLETTEASKLEIKPIFKPEAIDTIFESDNNQCEQEKQRKSKEENYLSISDWCIVFYYLDEAGSKDGSKIKRIEKFIIDNNIKNEKGKLTTKAFFKKEYYEIFNRINRGEKQLPPMNSKRIEKIFPFIKKNKEATQKAKSDIDYLNCEMAEDEKNNH